MEPNIEELEIIDTSDAEEQAELEHTRRETNVTRPGTSRPPKSPIVSI